MLTLPPLYAILDVESISARGWAPTDVCRAWLSAGVRLIQLRAKGLASGPFLDLADELADLCHEAGSLLIINDRADIAAMCGADGVHLGQEDITPADARAVVGDSALVGLSTHDGQQVSAGTQAPVSYLAIGPVFATGTKNTGYDPVGLSNGQQAATMTRASGLPLVGIGGITLERAQDVLGAGVQSVAVISDLLIPSNLAGVESHARAWVRLTGH